MRSDRPANDHRWVAILKNIFLKYPNSQTGRRTVTMVKCRCIFVFVFLSYFTVALIGCTRDKNVLQATAADSIRNPVAPSGADPWVTVHKGWYYYSYSRNNSVWVNRALRLQDAVQQTGKIVWTPPADQPYSRELWAPELHFLNGKWYIYVAADDSQNKNHRMVVLESKTEDAQGNYILRGKIAATVDKWAIDGTVMVHKGRMYFIWSGWEGDRNVQQNLYIARMRDPATIDGDRVMISKPEYPWETVGNPLINEGPEVLVNGDRTFVVYSASGSWTDSYCLGQLTLLGPDPMDPKAWRKKEIPVFSGTAKVISPGHASFTKSPDGTEDWIVYHAAKRPGAGWNRNVRMQRYTWDTDGNPVFGVPVPPDVPMAPPSER